MECEQFRLGISVLFMALFSTPVGSKDDRATEVLYELAYTNWRHRYPMLISSALGAEDCD